MAGKRVGSARDERGRLSHALRWLVVVLVAVVVVTMARDDDDEDDGAATATQEEEGRRLGLMLGPVITAAARLDVARRDAADSSILALDESYEESMFINYDPILLC